MRMVAWKAWYKGGRAYCSGEVLWAELPDDEALGFVVLFDNGERRMVSGSDLYWMVELEGDLTICQGFHDDHVDKRYPGAVLKKGAWTSDAEMRRVNDEMRDWKG